MELEQKKGVFVMSVFRATSTLLFKVLSQIIEQSEPNFGQDSESSALLLEPFSQPYYLEDSSIPCPGLTVQDSIPKTFMGAMNRVLSQKGKFVIVKDQGPQCQKFLLPENEKYVEELISMFNFVFLIRSPEQTIASHFHPYYEEKGKEAEIFASEEAGYIALRDIFTLIQRKTGESPLVVEAEDYLRDPVGTLGPVFNSCGLEFSPSFLSWPANSNTDNADFNLWGDTWYSELRKSKGLKIHTPATTTPVSTTDNTEAEEGKVSAPPLPTTTTTTATACPQSRPVSKYPNTVHNHEGLRAIYEEHFPAYEYIRIHGRRASATATTTTPTPSPAASQS